MDAYEKKKKKKKKKKDKKILVKFSSKSLLKTAM